VPERAGHIASGSIMDVGWCRPRFATFVNLLTQ